MIARDKKEAAHNTEQYADLSLAEALMKFIEKLFNFLRPSCTFEEFLEKTGEYFDERMVAKEKQDDVKCGGGKITFKLKGERVEMHSKLYFVDKAEKWTLQKSSNSIGKSRFNDWDTDKDLQRLSRGETVELDITPPE